ncbi:MAG: hypothetical protein K6T85_12580, partial [Gorillibacterium sp.]|nr:hypothetical protein [Gorillibacterium sp.]
AFLESLGYLRAQDLVEVKESDQRTLSSCRLRLTNAGVAYSQVSAESKSREKRRGLREALFIIGGAVIGSILTTVIGKFLS